MTMPPSGLKDLIKDCTTGRSIYAKLLACRCLTDEAVRKDSDTVTLIEEELQKDVPKNHVGTSAHDKVILMLLDTKALNSKAIQMHNNTRSWE
jgi:hypothetical protein